MRPSWLRRYAAVPCISAMLLLAAPAAAQPLRRAADVFPLAGFDRQSVTWGANRPGQPATRTRVQALDAAELADGTLLVSDYRAWLGYHVRVRKIGLDGLVQRVSGLGQADAIAAALDGGFLIANSLAKTIHHVSMDGRAVEVARRPAIDMAALPGGGFVAADADGDVVRRVAADGTVTRFAGTGRYGFRGDGGPAAGARLAEPSGVTVQPDGAVLIADTFNDRVRKVDPSGVISTLARMREPIDVVAAADGRFYVSVSDGIREYSPSGSLLRVYVTWTRDFARRRLEPDRLVLLRDGNVAFTALTDGHLTYSSDQRLWLLRVAPGERPLIALRDLRVSKHEIRATVATTAGGAATLSVRGRARMRARTVPVTEGIGQVRVSGRFPSTKQIVRVQLRDESGRIAEDRVTAWLGAKLRRGTARQVVGATVSGDDGGGSYVGRCRRMSARRIDCEVRYQSLIRRDRCEHVVAVILAKTGTPDRRSYTCRSGRSPFGRLRSGDAR